MIDRPRPDDPLGVLTERQREVLALMAEGRSNAASAERLTISEKAVVRHASNIYVVVGRVADRAGTEYPEGARLQRSGVVAQEPARLAAPPLHVDGGGDLRGRTVLGGVGDEDSGHAASLPRARAGANRRNHATSAGNPQPRRVSSRMATGGAGLTVL